MASSTNERKTEQITAEAALDGFYVYATPATTEHSPAPAIVRGYKQLKMSERAFRTIKDTLDRLGPLLPPRSPEADRRVRLPPPRPAAVLRDASRGAHELARVLAEVLEVVAQPDRVLRCRARLD